MLAISAAILAAVVQADARVARDRHVHPQFRYRRIARHGRAGYREGLPATERHRRLRRQLAKRMTPTQRGV